jgi:hypothetical protein
VDIPTFQIYSKGYGTYPNKAGSRRVEDVKKAPKFSNFIEITRIRT